MAPDDTWQERYFGTFFQRVLAQPLDIRMHYGHPDLADKLHFMTRGGISMASKSINLSGVPIPLIARAHPAHDICPNLDPSLRGRVRRLQDYTARR